MTGYLTLTEAAELLRVSPGTVRHLARREGLPLIRVSPRRYLVSEEGLAEWLDGRVVSGAPGRSTERPEAPGVSASRLPRLASDDDARSGSSARRRPPAASSRRSNVVSLAASQPRKAG
jgi:excisionase family DNA binding protein